MSIPILIEATSEQRYRASAGEPFFGSVEGDSPRAALKKLKQQIDACVAQGALIAAIDLPNGENPWLDGVEMFRDEPLFHEWQQAMADYRRAANQLAETQQATRSAPRTAAPQTNACLPRSETP